MSASALAAQQRWLQAAIGLPHDRALRAQAPQYLDGSPALDAAARLGIYQQAYRARLLQSFHAIFPALQHALGSTMLDVFALDFLEQHRPCTTSVNRIADGFAEHLQATRPAGACPDETVLDDLIVDLARLELALLRVSEAPGLEHSVVPDTAMLRTLEDSTLLARCPRAAPCLTLLACHAPLQHYWQAVRDAGAATLPAPRPTWLALSRTQFRLTLRELAPVQWQLLKRCDGQSTLDQILASVAALELRPAPTLELARVWLGNFLQQGLLAGC